MENEEKRRILIVEDDKFLLEIYVAVFTKENLEVLSSESGEDGLNLALKELPDIILLDIMLAGKMNGLDVLRGLRDHGNNPASHIPVIIMSNLNDDKTISEGLKLGANGYCVKSQTDPSDIVRNVLTFLK